MNYKRITPCIIIHNGVAIRWFDDESVISEDVVALAKQYNDMGADELIIFDLSVQDQEHEDSIDLIKKICKAISIPLIAGGNIRRVEDVKKILYAGATRAILNFSKEDSIHMTEEVSKRFGKERIAVSLRDFDELFKQQKLIEEYTTEIVLMHRVDLASVMSITEIPCVQLSDSLEESDIINCLRHPVIKGVSGLYVNQPNLCYASFKQACQREGVQLSSFYSKLVFSDCKLDEHGLMPIIVQDYKTNQVLMLAYMNEESYNQTVKTGKMTYFSRSRNELWVKGETSGHYQYLKELSIDCDHDTILAKVEQIGVACHTGAMSCFFEKIIEGDHEAKNPLQVLESVYETILDRMNHPKEGSYTNYLFDKGIDKILKKVGEEATEIILAAKNPNPEEIKYEVSDFLYHIMVMMVLKGVSWTDIMNELADR